MKLSPVNLNFGMIQNKNREQILKKLPYTNQEQIDLIDNSKEFFVKMDDDDKDIYIEVNPDYKGSLRTDSLTIDDIDCGYRFYDLCTELYRNYFPCNHYPSAWDKE